MNKKILKERNYFTIDGKKCKDTQKVGYCWYPEHTGYLTLPLMREHQCIERKCKRFQKYEEAPYWKTKEEHKKKKKKSFEKIKNKENKKEEILQLFRKYTNHIENFVITRVVEENNTYVVYFVTLEYIPLQSILEQVRRETNARIGIKEIKTTKVRKEEIIKKIKTEY